MLSILIDPHLAVIPILIGPLQVLIAVLPAILLAIGSALLQMFKPSAVKIGLKVLWRNKLTVLLLVAIVLGIRHGISLLPQREVPRAAVVWNTSANAWSLFRGGLSRRGGGVDGSPDPVAGGKVWEFKSDYACVYASPSLVGDSLYFAGSEVSPFNKNGSGSIYRLDALTGRVIWKTTPDGYRATFSSPSISSNYLVCGEGLHEVHDARIFCLRADNGKVLWSKTSSSHVESSGAILDGQVYIGGGKDGMYGLKLDTPAGGDPVVWHLTALAGDTNKTFHCDSSPAAAKGSVFFSSAMSWDGIVCVDAKTGKEKWHKDAPYPVWGSPTIVSNRLFIGMGNGNFIESAEQVWEKEQAKLIERKATADELAAAAKRFARGGQIWCLDTETGDLKWSYPLPETLLGAIAEADGVLYFASRDGVVKCLTVDGKEVMSGKGALQWSAHEGIVTSPAIGKEHIYFTTESGQLVGLNRKTLKPVWRMRLGSGSPFSSSPALGLGHIYVGTPANGLLSLGSQQEPVWGGLLGGPGKSGWTDGSLLPERGAFSWRWPAESSDETAGATTTPAITSPLAYSTNNLLLAGCRNGGTNGVAAFVIARQVDGEVKPVANAELAWFVPGALPVSLSPAVYRERMYVVDGRPSDAGRRLRCLQVTTGAPLWSMPVDAGASGEFSLTRERLYACVSDGDLACLGIEGTRAGQVLWTRPIGQGVGAPVVAGDTLLVATRGPDGLQAFDLLTGKPLWQRLLAAPPVAGVVASDDLVLTAVTNGLVASSAANGAVFWTFPCQPAPGPIVFNEAHIAVCTMDEEIIVLNWQGQEKGRIKSATSGIPPMLLDGELLYCKKGALQRFEFATDTGTRWLDASWLGAVTVPPVLVDGNVYFASATKGLVCAKGRK
ncbi:MAG: PQQ-binding-like beta-propeller repeat protein [bacterium]